MVAEARRRRRKARTTSKGKTLVVFVTLKSGHVARQVATKAALTEHIDKEIGKFARPRSNPAFADSLPKTRSAEKSCDAS